MLRTTTLMAVLVFAAAAARGQTVSSYNLAGNLDPHSGPGSALEPVVHTETGGDPTFTFESGQIDGEDAQWASLAQGTGFLMNHGLPSNGGGGYVNIYTLVMDVNFPEVSKWICLYNTNGSIPPANDGDAFVNPDNGIGISGNYGGTVSADTWHRIAIRVDSDTGAFTCFLDGQQVQENADSIGLDGRWALYGPDSPEEDLNFVQIFMDDTLSEMGAVRVANLALADWALPAGQIRQLGGATAGPIEIEFIEPPEVPAAGTISLIGLAVVCLAVGAWLLRRRVAPAAA